MRSDLDYFQFVRSRIGFKFIAYNVLKFEYNFIQEKQRMKYAAWDNFLITDILRIFNLCFVFTT